MNNIIYGRLPILIFIIGVICITISSLAKDCKADTYTQEYFYQLGSQEKTLTRSEYNYILDQINLYLSLVQKSVLDIEKALPFNDAPDYDKSRREDIERIKKPLELAKVLTDSLKVDPNSMERATLSLLNFVEIIASAQRLSLFCWYSANNVATPLLINTTRLNEWVVWYQVLYVINLAKLKDRSQSHYIFRAQD